MGGKRAIGEADQVGAKAVRTQAMVERATALTDVPERRDEGIAGLAEAVDEAEQLEDWVLLGARFCTTSATSRTALRGSPCSSECATPGGGRDSTTWSTPTTTFVLPTPRPARATQQQPGDNVLLVR